MSARCLLRPDIKTVGFSVENRPISLYLYGNEKIKTERHKLNTLFIGVFHGDEGISAQLLLRWVNHMENTGLKDNNFPPFGIIPVLNPDGHIKNQRVNANGVDLNRNYPTKDWQEENKGTIYYSGKSPASEPETQTLLSVLEQYQPGKIITVHSPYKVINFDGPARGLAEAMGKASGYPVTEDIGYATPGSFGTYLGKERHLAVITLELPDQEEIDERVWQDNHPSLEAALLYS
ncbi:MAG: M14 family zinc carboxypeptidase, partial [Vampirovibrionales bacterium]|nr:M14 family zinc carboxypeptidase [Vampirovibrionales bacterium]